MVSIHMYMYRLSGTHDTRNICISTILLVSVYIYSYHLSGINYLIYHFTDILRYHLSGTECYSSVPVIKDSFTYSTIKSRTRHLEPYLDIFLTKR